MELSRRAAPSVGLPAMETGVPTQNVESILNRATPAISIYQTSVNLLDKLACIDGFEVYLASLLDDSLRDTKTGTPYLNPIQLLWDTFRQGTSLCVIYNALQPVELLSTTLDESQNILKQRKDRVYRFVKACKENHIVRDEDLFTISELFKDDTNSFVKVLKTIEIVVETIQARGLLDTMRLNEKPSARFAEPQLGPPQDNRERVVKEFVETERRYVHDLELLQGYMDELQKKNIIPNESARYIFANLNAMVDFQRRFLIGIEANATQPPEDQHFGSVFVNMKEGFMVYEPYCANYTRASKLCIAEEESLKALSHIIEPHYELPSMLIKPVQRLCKYPMIMEELTKFYDKTSPVYAELREGISAINSIVEQVNEAERKEGNLAVVSDLEDRVEDWKGYSINTFGELFLHDSFVMSTTDVKRELLIYLFENILICCKEVNEKERRRNQKHKSNALQLKGRIFLFSIHSVVDTSRDGQLSLTIYWRDVVMENFSLACRTEDQLKLWKSTMERLITRNRERAPPMAEQPQGSPTTLIAHRVGSNQQYGTDYDSDEDTSVQRRGRYSEGSSLTIAMQQDKSSSSLSYRKTYDGAASRGRGGSAKKLAGDYQSELVDGIERSATISTFHRRQGTNGSGSSFGDAADSAPAFQNSPMQGGPYYGKHDVPPVPVPPLHRSTGDSVGRIHSQKAPGTLSIASPIPTAYSSSISPMTPGVAMGHSAMSALSTTGTPVPSLSNSYGLAPPLVAQAKPVKVKVHFQDDIFVIVVKHDLHMDDLVERVERKIKICAGPRVGISSEQDLAAAPPLGIRMKYQDEDGDMISIGSDDDVQLAFESANASRKDESTMSTLNLFVSL